ncbi:MAG: hypothetical protein ACE15F_03955 [bacterium]
MKHVRFTALSGCLLMLLFGFASTGVMAQESVIRAEINPPDGTKINFSAPLSLLQTLKTSIPGQLVQDRGEIEGAVDELISEFDSIRGKDLVRVEGPVQARIWVDEANGDDPEDLNFIQVRVQPAGGNQPDIQIRIPKGMIFLVSCITDQFFAKYGDEIFSAIRQNIPHQPQPPMPGEKMEKAMKKMIEKPEKSEKWENKEMPMDPKAIKKAVLEGILKELKEDLENEQ